MSLDRQNQIHQAQIGWQEVSENWVHPQTRIFIQSLSFKGYILAGNSVANMFEKLPLQGDLDFWASQPQDYLNALNQIKGYYTNFNIYPSMVQMYNTKGSLPRINLIFTQMTDQQTIQRFDFDYCRCYWTPREGIIFGTNCKQSILSKVIRYHSDSSRIMKKRILKAINYGYVFPHSFWMYQTHLLRHPDSLNRRNGTSFAPIKKQDLNLSKFRLRQVNLKIKDIHNVKQTLNQLADQYQRIANKANDNLKLPILVKLQSKNIHLLDSYVLSIVLQNPMCDAHYLKIKLGTRFVYSYHDEEQQGENQLTQKYNQQIQEHQQAEESYEQQQTPICNTVNDLNLNSFNQKNIKIIIPTKGEQLLVKLNQSGSAYIIVQYLPESLIKLAQQTFMQMWQLHPSQKHKIIMFEKQVQVSRYSQSFLNTPISTTHTKTHSYMYSGYNTSGNQAELPSLFEPYFCYMKQKNNKYNQVIVNWYQNENDFIAEHADCQRGMIQEAKIALVSFYPQSNESNFRKLDIVPKKNTKTLYDKFQIQLSQGTIITMCGTTQNEYLHGIAQHQKPTTPRISLSFRQMSQQMLKI